jgi:choline dehydrogenase-like flavoprotein
MKPEFDVIIVGSGPAGVSAAFPLLDAGLRVLMVDGGRRANSSPPEGFFVDERRTSNEQWRWMLGEDFTALRNADAVSPKLRVPGLRYAFEGFDDEHPMVTENFVAIGSLATGGLSNAWGCGVARLSRSELAAFPLPASEMDASYERVARRVGISGACPDDLADYFGLDAWAEPPIPMDENHRRLFDRYEARRDRFAALGMRIGRPRVAVLSSDRPRRRACDRSGNCLWGCERGSLYSASYDVEELRQRPSFQHRPGLIVDRVTPETEGITIHGRDDRSAFACSARRILLAAGTLATTRLASHALQLHDPLPLQSCPTAAFLLWLPARLGSPWTNAFGLGQLSYSLSLDAGITAFGSTFSTAGIPVSEFARRLPLGRRRSIDALQALLPSCVVGNIFLPGQLSAHVATLDREGTLHIRGRHLEAADTAMNEAKLRLRQAFRHAGAYLLPKSFTSAAPGADIHYAATLPMRENPRRGETDSLGELADLPGVHVVDGACLPILTEKSHTLTIMANADRIGHSLGRSLASA